MAAPDFPHPQILAGRPAAPYEGDVDAQLELRDQHFFYPIDHKVAAFVVRGDRPIFVPGIPHADHGGNAAQWHVDVRGDGVRHKFFLLVERLDLVLQGHQDGRGQVQPALSRFMRGHGVHHAFLDFLKVGRHDRDVLDVNEVLLAADFQGNGLLLFNDVGEQGFHEMLHPFDLMVGMAVGLEVAVDYAPLHVFVLQQVHGIMK